MAKKLEVASIGEAMREVVACTTKLCLLDPIAERRKSIRVHAEAIGLQTTLLASYAISTNAIIAWKKHLSKLHSLYKRYINVNTAEAGSKAKLPFTERKLSIKRGKARKLLDELQDKRAGKLERIRINSDKLAEGIAFCSELLGGVYINDAARHFMNAPTAE